ncbi:BgtE-20116 [Blumeria graminis f. sp. tritici]|uniref:BgtE-20116 n=2 Tax=Blumeria graminis f. sp. tritici TaxID=62690 RepID=A0A9X9MNI6_BLUGR|nr:BgtE-20116 [Blumeria graminis f. sp. tritici]
MKTSVALYLALMTLQISKIGATIAENDYICGTDVLIEKNINNSLQKACNTLYQTRKAVRYPADYDASDTFYISDARLFSWPMLKDDRLFTTGRAGNLRLIMDSDCRFIGIIMKTINEPDKRCFRPVAPPREIDDSSNPSLRKIPVLRGYNCEGKVFESFQVEQVRKETLRLFNFWISKHLQTSLNRLKVFEEFFGSIVFLLPTKSPSSPKQLREIVDYSYYIAIDFKYETLGMVYKTKDNWVKYDGLWEMEPERRQINDPQKNSIGEAIFEGLSAYKCDSFKFSRETINSHMQVACGILQKVQKSPAHVKRGRVCPAVVETDTGSLTAWKFPLQLPEKDLITGNKFLTHDCVIILDKQCHFHGVYRYSKKMSVKCNRSSPQDLQKTHHHEATVSDSSWIDEMIDDGSWDLN